MQVNLAGYNIDSSLIKQLNSIAATPEVLSAAYARISRSPKTVTELRAEALLEIEKARKSNQNIIFEMGHSSVAEHAVFNFDIIGISRLLAETLETIRFASFTEKSQRYVTFTKDYVIPPELEGPQYSELRFEYTLLIDSLFKEYESSFKALVSYYNRIYPSLTQQERECKAKEDARYILPLATKTQLGMTLNARSLETLLRRLNANPFQEARQLHDLLLAPVKELCPSLLRHTGQDAFTGTFKAEKLRVFKDDFDLDESVRAINMTMDPDDLILTALLYEQTSGDYQRCRQRIAALDFDAKQELWQQIFAQIRPWHKMPRAFELVDITFELRMSESCWAQFKRHRVGTMIKQQRDTYEMITKPEEMDLIGHTLEWETILQRLDHLRPRLRKVFPDISPYIRINADKVKVLAKMNLREIYHFTRLRSDSHAQWEIRNLSHQMTNHIRVLCPFASSFLCGKSEF